ncbi:MAG: hypothetical protein KGM99_17665 [Burkholderiales bacterium]|nr:hypothetical protein [Burkholderiales bacterium]
MFKKTIFLMLASSSLLAGMAYSQEEFGMMSMATPTQQQEATPAEMRQENVDSNVSSGNDAASVQLDRGGMDRASVHLQLLQQSNSHFSDNTQAKKTGGDNKKMPSKPSKNS